MQIYPVILSGGSGTRLWPVSRPQYPKQLLSIASDLTMLQATVARTALPGFAPPMVVTGEGHRFYVSDQLKALGAASGCILLEPEPRNTAAAIALAALTVADEDDDALMLVMPSDHVIAHVAAFHDAVKKGVPAGEAGHIVTFGIIPERAETGYGYIEAQDDLAGHEGVRAIHRFTEKPDGATAEAWLHGKRHFWNSGIFLMSARTCLAELERHAPDLMAACRAAMADARSDGIFLRPDRDAFVQAPSISFDHAVMEHSGLGAVVPVDMGWSDLGSWQAVWEVGQRDENGNIIKGDVVALESHNSLFRNENGPTIAAIGVCDLVVVAMRDAILVMPRERAQDVRLIAERFDASGVRPDSLHNVVHRPWGTYETTDRGHRFQNKRIVVKPGEKLSLQMHHHRSEHWVVVSGTARVTVGDKVFLLQENQSTYVPAGTVHRLENPGHIPLHLIEVQCGAYLGEDDIVRLEDSYGRTDMAAE